MSARPIVTPPAAWSFPASRSFTLDNGIQVLLYPLPGQHVVSTGLCLDLPLTSEDAALEGVAALTARCLVEGTASYPGASFGETLEARGGIMDAHAGHSATLVWMDAAAPRLGPTLDLLAEAVQAPALADADIERHRSLRLAEIDQETANPHSLVGLVLRGALIDARYRASRPAAGTTPTVASITPADVRRFHADAYGPRGATIVLAGDIDEDALALVERAFGAWTNPSQRAASHEVPRPLAPGVHIIDRPGSVQADVRLGRFTIDRTDPRWPALQIAGHALGGAFGSRLNRVLREEKGFTYGAGLTTQPLRHGGWTTLHGAFRTEVAAEAIGLMPALVDVTADPLTQAEVDDARNYLLGTAPMRHATASGVCNAALGLISAGVSPSYIDEHRRALMEVTPATATQAAVELLPRRDGTLVVVGDRAAIAPGLASAGWHLTD